MRSVLLIVLVLHGIKLAAMDVRSWEMSPSLLMAASGGMVTSTGIFRIYLTWSYAGNIG